MNQDMKFAVILIIVGSLLSIFTTTDWGGWVVALGILIGLCA